MTVTLKWYPPSWVQIKIKNKIIYMHHLKANPLEFKTKLEGQSDIKALLLQLGETYQLS